MNRILEKLSLDPDLSRGLRAATAFSAASIACFQLGQPLAAQFVATAALNLSLVQLRGAYYLRFLTIIGMTATLVCSGFLGGLTSSNPFAAVLGIGFLALLSGMWRQLSSSYGPSLSVGSALLFLLALEGSHHGAKPLQIAAWTAMGGVTATILHLGLWLFRPQHALRHAVAEAWIAVSDLCLAARPISHGELPSNLLRERQRILRETLDRTTAALTAVESKTYAPLLAHLDRMRHEAAHLATQVIAFLTSSEPLLQSREFRRHVPTFDSLMVELANVARSVAGTLIVHREEHLERTRIRIQTCQRLARVFEAQLANDPEIDRNAPPQIGALLRAIETELLTLESALAETVEHSASGAVAPIDLPDISDRSLRSLAADPAPSSHKIDPLLLRHSIRMTVISTLAVGIYTGFSIQRGNWIAIAAVVVLQPDYGSTRQRAAARVGGTFAGALVGSALLFISMPIWLLGFLGGAMAFGFAYFLRRQYGIAVFFVTVMLVLITEIHVPVHVDFTLARLLSNLFGAAIALVAALYFWPTWERSKLPGLLSKAIQANKEYFDAVSEKLAAGKPFDRAVVLTKQQAERAGNIAVASLQRMQAEPARKRLNTDHTNALVTCNQRVTSAITVLATHLDNGSERLSPECTPTVDSIRKDLESMAQATGSIWSDRSRVNSVAEPPPESVPISRGDISSVSWSLEKIMAEVRALELAVNELKRDSARDNQGTDTD